MTRMDFFTMIKPIVIAARKFLDAANRKAVKELKTSFEGIRIEYDGNVITIRKDD